MSDSKLTLIKVHHMQAINNTAFALKIFYFIEDYEERRKNNGRINLFSNYHVA